jgi:hypothetical protein
MTLKTDFRLELADRIAKHDPPGLHPVVDKELLAGTARRLQRSVDVLKEMKCDPRPQ